MATQIVMDHTGDTRHYFDAEDTETLLKAEERFKALTSAGFTAAVRAAAGDAPATRSFGPGAQENSFYPQPVAGRFSPPACPTTGCRSRPTPPFFYRWPA